MDVLKKIFPLSWKYVADVANLIIGIIIYVVIDLIPWAVGLVFGILPEIPVITSLINVVMSILGTVIGIYAVAGIVILILVYTKVIKD